MPSSSGQDRPACGRCRVDPAVQSDAAQFEKKRLDHDDGDDDGAFPRQDILWELSCAGFRHSASFHARVIVDGAACRLGEPGDVHDVLGVLGVDRVVPIVVLRVLVSW